MDQFLGEIRLFGFNFAPVGWAQCNGQILSISQFSALFSLLGTNFGGNGTSNFGLPNLQGIVPIDQGAGLGLTPFSVGETGGETTVTLNINEMPRHTHAITALPIASTVETPVAGSHLSQGHGGSRGTSFPIRTYTTQAPGTTLSNAAVGTAGGSLPHDNMQPSLVMNWCIAMQGIFPARP
jgi:microcystin-dependent protein